MNDLLKPQEVFGYFAEINCVPRPSKKEEKMIAYLKDFGAKNKLETIVDEAGNVLIKKPAAKGYEGRKTTVLQSHIDMVCEKNAGSTFDFLKDPIETYVDGDWMKARGTTLGADDGIGVAMQLAVLADNRLEHGELECLFTCDEETGLTGAAALQPGFITGDYLLNLDSEDEGQLFVSCAGGAKTEALFSFQPMAAPADFFFFRIRIKGLSGGHSGDDIDKGRANANKLLARALYTLSKTYDLRLSDIQSGGLHNAIPREGFAVCGVPLKDKEAVRVDLNVLTAELEDEFGATEPALTLLLESVSNVVDTIEPAVTTRLLAALQAVDNGVFAMSQAMKGLVETSSNLASVRREEGGVVRVITSQRSSLTSARRNMSATIRALFELAGAKTETGEGYPGWKMNPQSDLRRIAIETYRALFHKEPEIKAIHAGLECGLFSEKFPQLDMLSFGPTLRGVHSPDEKLLIPTVWMVWNHLLAILRAIPEREARQKPI